MTVHFNLKQGNRLEKIGEKFESGGILRFRRNFGQHKPRAYAWVLCPKASRNFANGEKKRANIGKITVFWHHGFIQPKRF